MRRIAITPRKNWQQTVESQGLIYHTPNGNTYWDESAYYSFTAKEVDELEASTNTLHEMCLNAVQHVIDKNRFRELHISDAAAQEDAMTSAYMRDTAEQAGIKTAELLVDEIGWNGRDFTAPDERPIHSCFKLYPWEWIMREEFAPHVSEAKDVVNWIEPIWKMVLSNKGILPILWELYPNHDNLLKSYFGSAREMSNYARKPLLSREGANISLTTNEGETSTGGLYGEEGYIYQELAPIPSFTGMHPVIGSWVIDGESAGMGIRESDTLVTTNLSRFVPHLFEG